MLQSCSPDGDSLRGGRVCLELAWLLPMSRHTSTSESRDALLFILVERSGDVVTLPGVVSGPVRRLFAVVAALPRCAGLIRGNDMHRGTVSEQAQVDCPPEGFRPGHYAELLVDRLEVAFYRVAGNVKSGSDLQVGAARQELEDA
jgi:hypothetical protein